MVISIRGMPSIFHLNNFFRGGEGCEGSMDHSDLKRKLIKKAIRKHSYITPCANKKNFDDCFTYNNGRLYFWYNISTGSTKVISAVYSRGISVVTVMKTIWNSKILRVIKFLKCRAG
jgi:hypothetical protein